jgi:RNA polymerase subunit RPABC4/transcription elongation factor Spt4
MSTAIAIFGTLLFVSIIIKVVLIRDRGGVMKCPLCGKENTDNWPVTVDDGIKNGGCQMCWEKQCDEEWWKLIVEIDKVLNNETMVTK